MGSRAGIKAIEEGILGSRAMVDVQETQELLNWIIYAFVFDYRGISSHGKKIHRLYAAVTNDFLAIKNT